MNTFELLWFLFWLGGGGMLGYYVGYVPGMLVGVGVGFAASYLFSRVLVPHPNDWPACECGSPWASLLLEEHPIYSWVHRCNNCGAAYVMRKGTTWSCVLADGTTTLSMTRNWPGRWKSVQVTGMTSNEPPNKPLQPPAQRTRRG